MSKKKCDRERCKNNSANMSRKYQNTGTNRQYKDRLFKALFGSPDRKDLTLELYNAMNGSSYTNPEDIELSTIGDVVYMGMRNDVSFLFGQTMNLWEQQSTRNPNMPLRFLLYYAHVMERYVEELPPESGDIYSSAQVWLPMPEMVLFYNGPGELPEYLHLSDAYPSGTKACVEVHVRVININSGQDRILKMCQPLQDYTTFVEAFRAYRVQDGVRAREAASRAIEDLSPGVVKSYLVAHRAEVIDMLLTEYNEQKTLKAERYVGRLNMLCDLVNDGTLPIETAVMKAAVYGITDEAAFRRYAAEQGIHLPE